MIVTENTKAFSVLLIEDNPGDQLLIKEQLNDACSEFSIRICSAMSEALEALDNENFDIIILDPGLPDSSGLGSLKSVLKTKTSTPVIVLTVNDSDEMGVLSIQNGAQDYLNKSELLPQSLNKSILYAINRNTLERDLTRSLRMYESAFEQAVVGFAHLSGSSLIHRVNQKFCDILGYSKDELLGKSIEDITFPDDLSKDLTEFNKLISGKIKYYSLEKRFIRKDGSIIWTNITRTTILNSENEGNYYFTTLEDITERKALLAEFHKQKAMLENIFSIIPVGISIMDSEGTLINNNKKFEEIWIGSEYKNINDHKKYRAWNPATGEQVPYKEWGSYKALKNKETTIGEILQIECFDGTKKVIMNSAIPLIIEDKVIAAVAVVEDITKLAETENELKKLLSEKDVLVKESNHRIKNNLQLMSSLLNLQAANSEDLYVKKVLFDSISRIASVSFLHDYLYRSSSLNAVNIRTYINKITEHIRKILLTEANNITMVQDIEDIEVRSGLAVAIGLVISELITNAVKYAFHRRKEGIVYLELKKNGKNIQLLLNDNGKGMNENINIKTAPSLGLQIVYAMISQYHGTIDYEVNKGTKFTISLPLK